MKKNYLIGIFLCAAMLSSCKKEKAKSISFTGLGTSVVNTPFNWETATQMEVSPTVPTSNVPAMPWSSQSGTPINANFIQDNSYNDGWRLVYNTFNSSVLPYANNVPTGGLYFALYNIYRGILRFYVYLPSGYVNNNSNIEHGLSVYTSGSTTTKMLNFDGVDIVDPSASANSFSMTNNVGVSSGGGWYAMQYELAYDPLFAATTYPNLGIQWNSKTVTISEIKLSGTAITAPSLAAKQGSGFNWTNVSSAAKIIQIFGHSDTDSGVKYGKIITALTGGIAGTVVNFFSGIFGGSTGNPQSAVLKLNANLTVSGTLTSSQPLVPNSLVAPGQTVANTINSPVPLYTDVMGVFNISTRPQIKLTGQITFDSSQGIAIHQSSFSIIPGSYTIQINPAVAAMATVEEVNHEILLPEELGGTGFYTQYGKTLVTEEEVGDLKYYRLQEYGSSISGLDFPEVGFGGQGKAVVRFVFRVTPNNGAPSSLLVKTFLADISSFEQLPSISN